MNRTFVMAVMLLASTAHAQSTPTPGFFADAQVLWFDSEYNSDFELAPRFILGYDNDLGARVRYWTYDHDSFLNVPIVGASSGFDRTQRLAFDVIDLEGLTHIRWESSDVLVSGGARIAVIDHDVSQTNRNVIGNQIIEETYNATEGATFGGLTFAADGRTRIFSTISAVYGGRLSILQGDWSGRREAGLLPSANMKNETMLVPEVYAGIEATLGRYFTRFGIEFQEWNGRGRAGEAMATGGHDFGFTGYGFDLGLVF